MIFALVCGAGLGLGLYALYIGLRPTRPHLAAALANLGRPAHPEAMIGADDLGGLAAAVGRPLARRLSDLPLVPSRVQADLVVLGRPAERHLAEKVALALVGLLLAPSMAGLLALVGIALPLGIPVWIALVCAVGGFVLPDFGVHSEAERRRSDFRHALGSFLDLVVISLAGGSGVEGALAGAAAVGQGRAFAQLREALEIARLSRVAPWEPLGRLGQELGVLELVELSASVALAGSEGARVRASLQAKAASLRAHALADAETEANATSERMSLPVVALFAGFLVFVGYPALAHVLGGL